ncbi:hypothetical protein [Mesorhizobium sp. A556]
MIALKGKRKDNREATHEEKQRFYSMLLWLQQERGYASGYVAHKFKDRFGVWPRAMEDRTAEPDAVFLNWTKSRQIAWAKGKKKQEAAHAA